MKNALIIFTKNLVYGKVKTRLAATIGNDKAFSVYKKLIEHTYLITKQFNCNKIVFYSDELIEEDIWNSDYQKQVQIGNDLGERMMNAFNLAFKHNYKQIIIIGTDCAELNDDIINKAFVELNKYDVIIGPASDGGYYLLGIKEMHKQLFENIKWSTSRVFDETIGCCNNIGLKYYLLPTLHDVDEEKDLPYMKAIL